MSPPSLKQPIAIARAKDKKMQVSREPQTFIDVICEMSKACLCAIFIIALVVSVTALLALAGVATRCLIALW